MNLTVRRAAENDLPAVSRLALELTRQHQAYDPRRFVSFGDHEAQLYKLFKGEIKNPEAVVLVAELDGRIVGYAYVGVQEPDLVEISERRAWLHDIYVDGAARGLDAGKRLLRAAADVARKGLGVSVLMLQVAPRNERARELFEGQGFRQTLLEMMLDLSEERG